MARSILDGHIVLSRDIASKNHYPAIDVLVSASRVMNDVTDKKHQKLRVKYENSWLLIAKRKTWSNIGAYRQGCEPNNRSSVGTDRSHQSTLETGASENVSAASACSEK